MEKWIIYRHINDFKLLCTIAKMIKSKKDFSLAEEEKIKQLENLKQLGLYNQRFEKISSYTLKAKINQLGFYMFGYVDSIGGESKFLFSPLGNLLLNNLEDGIKTTKIFLSMLFGLQFEHKHSNTSNEFQLYPFRLIFKLLTDERIGKKLFTYETAYLILKIKTIDNESYEKLIQDILNLRTKNSNELHALFLENERLYVNANYEWDTYTTKLLSTTKIIIKEVGEPLFRLCQGKGTIRVVRNSYIKLDPLIEDFCMKMLTLYPYDKEPLKFSDNERMKSDVVKEIYNFYPSLLLDEINESSEKSIKLEKMLELPKLIEQYSQNNNNEEASLFEDILEDGFNMFINVEAKKIAGAGNTDIECLYLDLNKKFAVEAKATKGKLSLINAGRLAKHREKIGGDYTIVIAPRFVPSIKYDIQSTNIVTLRANTFSEYLYNCIYNDLRDIDYKDFDDIIINNLGKDISEEISKLTINTFAIV